MSARNRIPQAPGPRPPDPPPPTDTRDIEEERYQEWVANARFVKTLLKSICGILFSFLLFFIIVVVTAGAYYESNFTNKVSKGSPARWSLGLNQHVPPEVMALFEIYDSDRSGTLEPWEFQYVAKLLNERGTDPFEFQEEIPEGEGVTVFADYSPMQKESMKTFQDEKKSYFKGFMSEKKHFTGLFSWTEPEFPTATHSQQNFRSFLPQIDSLEVGMPYRLVSSMFGEEQEEIYNSNRYTAPEPTGREVLLFKLLQQFHHNVFLQNRFGPRGGVAVIRAKVGSLVDIVFRIHAEFQLNAEPQLPFWFTPAHFAGSLLFDTDANRVLRFELYLPTLRKLNVDMEWIVSSDEIEGEKMEVDIGYTSSMRLHTNLTLDPTPWEEEVSAENATLELERILYPFKKISYLEIRDAVETARAEHKLVHSIIMWGSLDDQSC